MERQKSELNISCHVYQEYAPVLAMYDIRAKQEFVFRTNKIKEIVGASWIIRDCFDDYLFPKAEELYDGCKGIFSYKKQDNPLEHPFSPASFKEKMTQKGYIGEVVYDGGGNFLVLFKNETVFQDVTYLFTKELLKNIGTLRVLGTYVAIEKKDGSDEYNFDDYNEDNRRLYLKHRINEGEESIIGPWACLPFVQVDRKTSMPIIKKDGEGDFSKESYAKLTKYKSVRNSIRETSDRHNGVANDYFIMNTDIFDEMVEKKGEDSQLAVVYIDGNNMGYKVQGATEGLKSYEECLNGNTEKMGLRRFSESIQETYVENGIQAALGKNNDKKHRLVVFAGDEINFVVKGSDALQCTRDYLSALNPPDSACAGIAVFHSHAPYADAYRIAEEACESAKKKMKEKELEETNEELEETNGIQWKNVSMIDFHICQGSIGVSLDQIREEELQINGNEKLISRPWLIVEKGAGRDVTSLGDVDYLVSFFNDKLSLSHSNIKCLAETAYRSAGELELELSRIKYRMTIDQRKNDEIKDAWEWLDKMKPLEKRKIIYDVVLAYDLWFAEKG